MPRIDVEPPTPIAHGFDQAAPSTPVRPSTPPLAIPSSPKQQSLSLAIPIRQSPRSRSSAAANRRHQPYPASPSSSVPSSAHGSPRFSRTTSEASYSSGGNDDEDSDQDDSGSMFESPPAGSESDYNPSPSSTVAQKTGSVVPSDILTSPAPSKPTKKKSHARKTPPGHIKRPPNAFILFRSHCCTPQANPDGSLPPGTPTAQQLGELGITDHRHISRIASHLWKALAPPAKHWWEAKAKEMKEEHARMYPDYKYQPSNRIEDVKRKRKKVLEDQVESEKRGCEEIAQALMTGEELFDPNQANNANASSPDGASSSANVTKVKKRAPRKKAPRKPRVPKIKVPDADASYASDRPRWTIETVAQSLATGQAVLPAPPRIRRQRKPSVRYLEQQFAESAVAASPEMAWTDSSSSSLLEQPQSEFHYDAYEDRYLPVVAGPPRMSFSRPSFSFEQALDQDRAQVGSFDERFAFPSTASAFVPAMQGHHYLDEPQDAGMVSPTNVTFAMNSPNEEDASNGMNGDAMLVSPTATAFAGRRTSLGLGQWELRRSYSAPSQSALAPPLAIVEQSEGIEFGDAFYQSITDAGHSHPRQRQITGESVNSSSAWSRPGTSSSEWTDEDHDDAYSTSYPMSNATSTSSWTTAPELMAAPIPGESTVTHVKSGTYTDVYHVEGESFFSNPLSALQARQHHHHALQSSPSLLAAPLYPPPEQHLSHSFENGNPYSSFSFRRQSRTTLRGMPGPITAPSSFASLLEDDNEDQPPLASAATSEPAEPSPLVNRFGRQVLSRDARGSEATIRAFVRSPRLVPDSRSPQPDDDDDARPNEESHVDEDEEKQHTSTKDSTTKKSKIICLSREQAKNKALVDQIGRSGYAVEIDDSKDE